VIQGEVNSTSLEVKPLPKGANVEIEVVAHF
jgi:hypothetical protein